MNKPFANLSNPKDLSAFTNTTATSTKIGKGVHRVTISAVSLEVARTGTSYLKVIFGNEEGKTRIKNIFFTSQDKQTNQTNIHWNYTSLAEAIVSDIELRSSFFGEKCLENAELLTYLVGAKLDILVALETKGITVKRNDSTRQFYLVDVESDEQVGTESWVQINEAYEFIKSQDMKQAHLEVKKMTNIGDINNDVLVQSIIQAGGNPASGKAVPTSGVSSAPRTAL